MDFQCPYCRQFYAQTYPSLKRLYIDPGKVRFYVMDFPLEIHSTALAAANAGRCASEQNRFWGFFDSLESDKAPLDLQKLIEIAGKNGVDGKQFKTCLETTKYDDVIRTSASDYLQREYGQRRHSLSVRERGPLLTVKFWLAPSRWELSNKG